MVAVGAAVGGTVPVVVRNNTGAEVAIEVVGTARDAAGTLIGFGSGTFTFRYVVPPGDVATVSVRFGDTDLPADGMLTVEATGKPPTSNLLQDLNVVEAVLRPDSILGIVRNGREAPVSGPINVEGVCFDAEGVIRGYYSGFAAKMTLAPDETSPFDATFYGSEPCDAFLIGARGYAS